jgi:[ribosomal protein S5]-alanine N-acetyltransferase
VNSVITSGRLLLRPIERADVVALHRLFDECGFGILGVRERNASQLIGFAGYWPFRTPPALELLFGVASDAWNRGIATESSRSVIRYGFDVPGFQTIEASTDAANADSVRVLEKLGMSLWKRAVVDELDTLFYTLQREAWQNASDQSAAADAPRTVHP